MPRRGRDEEPPKEDPRRMKQRDITVDPTVMAYLDGLGYYDTKFGSESRHGYLEDWMLTEGGFYVQVCVLMLVYPFTKDIDLLVRGMYALQQELDKYNIGHLVRKHVSVRIGDTGPWIHFYFKCESKEKAKATQELVIDAMCLSTGPIHAIRDDEARHRYGAVYIPGTNTLLKDYLDTHLKGDPIIRQIFDSEQQRICNSGILHDLSIGDFHKRDSWKMVTSRTGTASTNKMIWIKRPADAEKFLRFIGIYDKFQNDSNFEFTPMQRKDYREHMFNERKNSITNHGQQSQPVKGSIHEGVNNMINSSAMDELTRMMKCDMSLRDFGSYNAQHRERIQQGSHRETFPLYAPVAGSSSVAPYTPVSIYPSQRVTSQSISSQSDCTPQPYPTYSASSQTGYPPVAPYTPVSAYHSPRVTSQPISSQSSYMPYPHQPMQGYSDCTPQPYPVYPAYPSYSLYPTYSMPNQTSYVPYPVAAYTQQYAIYPSQAGYIDGQQYGGSYL